jgi:hypothetical protein
MACRRGFRKFATDERPSASGPRPSADRDEYAELRRFLDATAIAVRARAYDVARVNAALTVACALQLLNDDPEQVTRSPNLGAETIELVVALERRGKLPLDFAHELRELLASCTAPVFPRTDTRQALAALDLASRAAALALGQPNGSSPA